MIRLLLRRLAGMVPTLFGITLVTFALVQLAPGDPVALELEGGVRAGAVSERVVEDFRHAFFLDLPLFVNLEPEDAQVRVDRLVTRLGHPEEREEAVRDLVALGGAALPHLVPRIEGTTGELRDALLLALAGIARVCGLGDELEASEDQATFWAEYWEVYRLDYSPGRARRLVRRLVRREDPLARAELRRLHTYACQPLVEALGGRDATPQAQRRLVAMLHDIRGSGPEIAEDSTAEERRDTLAAWQEWWRREHARYETFGTVRRATAILTETQYAMWLSRIATLSFGVSHRDGRPIADKLAERLPVTLLLSLLSVVLVYALSIPLGVFSALRRDSLPDRLVSVVLFVLYSLPVFWVATLLIEHVTGVAGPAWFPLGGLSSDGAEGWPLWERTLDLAHHLVLPVVCLSYVSLAVISRYQRSAMLDALTQDYVRTARAKGLPWTRVVVRHALRNALLPVVTLLGMQLPYLIGGSVIVERIFNVPGMGLETFEAIRTHDYNWIMAVVTISAVLTMVGILASDLLYAVLDPRVRVGAAPGEEEA